MRYPFFCILINTLLFVSLTTAEYYEYSKSVKTYYKNSPDMISSASTVTNTYASSPTPNPPMAYASPPPPSVHSYANPPSPIVVKGTYATTPNTFTVPPVAQKPNANGFMTPPNASGFMAPPNASGFMAPPNLLATPPQLTVPPPIPLRTPPSRSNSRYNRNMKIPPPFV